MQAKKAAKKMFEEDPDHSAHVRAEAEASSLFARVTERGNYPGLLDAHQTEERRRAQVASNKSDFRRLHRGVLLQTPQPIKP